MAGDLISREALLKTLNNLESTGGHKYYRKGANDVLHEIMPQIIADEPAIDAVEVVRCENCIYWTRVSGHVGKCPFLIGEQQYAISEHYCSCGERREADAVD